MNINIPEHLTGHVTVVGADDLPFEKTWLDQLGFKVKIIQSGNDWFNILFSGARYEDGLIGPESSLPLVVNALAENTDQTITLFDQRMHGYESILVERREFDVPQYHQYLDPFNEQKFRIYFLANSSIDFEDEYLLTEDGQILTLDRSYRDLDWLRANAFDYIAIFLENINGEFTKLMELELA